jgi:hypothetical protein
MYNLSSLNTHSKKKETRHLIIEPWEHLMVKKREIQLPDFQHQQSKNHW